MSIFTKKRAENPTSQTFSSKCFCHFIEKKNEQFCIGFDKILLTHLREILNIVKALF